MSEGGRGRKRRRRREEEERSRLEGEEERRRNWRGGGRGGAGRPAFVPINKDQLGMPEKEREREKFIDNHKVTEGR
jgi:hypothetical protein